MSDLKRVIPCLDIDDGRVVKGTNFIDIRDAGDPVELAERYDAGGADELIFLDITASHEGRDTIVELARRTADNVFIPFTIGGGIRDTAYIRRAGFPMFYKYTIPGDAVGRFNIVDFGCPVSIGGVRVNFGDYVFGDEDGICIVPREITLEVLEKSEETCAKENRMRDAIDGKTSLADLYKTFGKF